MSFQRHDPAFGGKPGKTLKTPKKRIRRRGMTLKMIRALIVSILTDSEDPLLTQEQRAEMQERAIRLDETANKGRR
jgi:hypothetical protein